jgi:hypothetical protein
LTGSGRYSACNLRGSGPLPVVGDTAPDSERSFNLSRPRGQHATEYARAFRVSHLGGIRQQRRELSGGKVTLNDGWRIFYDEPRRLDSWRERPGRHSHYCGGCCDTRSRGNKVAARLVFPSERRIVGLDWPSISDVGAVDA